MLSKHQFHQFGTQKSLPRTASQPTGWNILKAKMQPFGLLVGYLAKCKKKKSALVSEVESMNFKRQCRVKNMKA